MAEHETPGNKLSRRLASRSTLSRQSMADGGEVYKGPLARRALRAVGARAMTMDRTIIVDDDFDPHKPEDQALYAHERVHQMESGGDDHPSDLRDAEEVAARAVERMVVHRSAAGEDFSSIMRDVASRASASVPESKSATKSAASPTDQAYSMLLSKGMSHQQIVDMLALKVLDLMGEQERERAVRDVPVRSV